MLLKMRRLRIVLASANSASASNSISPSCPALISGHRGFVAKCIDTHSPLLVKDALRSPLYDDSVYTRLELPARSSLSVPVLAIGERDVLGALELINKASLSSVSDASISCACTSARFHRTIKCMVVSRSFPRPIFSWLPLPQPFLRQLYRIETQRAHCGGENRRPTWLCLRRLQ